MSNDKHEWTLPKEERGILRELANKQAEYACLPVMEQRRQMWYDLNDGVPDARPPVIVETWTFDRDFMPPEVFRCQTPLGRGIEGQLLRNVRNHELINDDKVMPDAFGIGWRVHIDEMGVQIGREAIEDSQGYRTGYRFIHPIKDLERDFHLLKPAVCNVDRESTFAWKAFLEDLFAGILPVTLQSGVYGCRMLTHRVVELMGMELFLLSMFDCPDELHALMAYLRDNALRIMRWAESEGLLILNNGNQCSFGSSYNFTRQLPRHGKSEGPARLCDMWGNSNSQETVAVSPEMFHEFCFPYYRDVCEPLGLLYYGCCEPTHPFWDDLSQLPHLKKISISKWCDEKFMGDVLRGSKIVFSRKPDPAFFGVDVALDEEGWAAHVRETLEATKGVAVEFIVRDVYTVHGNLNKPKRAVEIARREIEKYR